MCQWQSFNSNMLTTYLCEQHVWEKQDTIHSVAKYRLMKCDSCLTTHGNKMAIKFIIRFLNAFLIFSTICSVKKIQFNYFLQFFEVLKNWYGPHSSLGQELLHRIKWYILGSYAIAPHDVDHVLLAHIAIFQRTSTPALASSTGPGLWPWGLGFGSAGRASWGRPRHTVLVCGFAPW